MPPTCCAQSRRRDKPSASTHQSLGDRAARREGTRCTGNMAPRPKGTFLPREASCRGRMRCRRARPRRSGARGWWWWCGSWHRTGRVAAMRAVGMGRQTHVNRWAGADGRCFCSWHSKSRDGGGLFYNISKGYPRSDARLSSFSRLERWLEGPASHTWESPTWASTETSGFFSSRTDHNTAAPNTSLQSPAMPWCLPGCKQQAWA